MARDSILDDAEQSGQDETDAEPEPEPADDAGGDSAQEDGSSDRTQFTQRTPADLLEDVERVQEEYGLPSRNATINFMLKQAAKDL